MRRADRTAPGGTLPREPGDEGDATGRHTSQGEMSRINREAPTSGCHPRARGEPIDRLDRPSTLDGTPSSSRRGCRGRILPAARGTRGPRWSSRATSGGQPDPLEGAPPGAGSEHWRKDDTDARRANPLEPGVVLMSEDGPQPWLRTFRAHGPSPTLDAGLLPAASTPSSVPSPLHTPRLPDRNGEPQPLSKTQTCHCQKSAMTVSHRAASRT